MDEFTLRRRNFRALLVEGSLFLMGLSFLDINATIPVFIYAYTRSVLLAGLATTLNIAAPVVTQTIVGPFVGRIRDIPAYITRIMLVFRPLIVLMVPILFANLSPMLTVALFLVLYGLLWCSDGLIYVPWVGLFGRTVAPERRGRLLGYQQLWGGLGCLGTGFFIRHTLNRPDMADNQRFALLFGCAAALLAMSALIMLFVRDLPRKDREETVNPLHFYRRLPGYFRQNRPFQRLVAIRILAGFVSMISPFLVLYGVNTFSLTDGQMSTLVYLQIVGSLLGGVVWGYISSRKGNKYVIFTSLALGLFVPLAALGCLALSGPAAFALLCFIVVLNGMNAGSWLGYINYTMDIVEEAQWPYYMPLSNLILFPLSLIPFAAGALADHWGYEPLFVISAAAAVVALFLARRLRPPHRLRD